MLDNIYNLNILKFAANISKIGRLKNPHCSGKAYSTICGSNISVDLIFNKNYIIDYAQEVKTCIIGQASSAIIANNIIGSSIESVKELNNTVYLMLKYGGKPPQTKFKDFVIFKSIINYNVKHISVMLVLKAILNATINNS